MFSALCCGAGLAIFIGPAQAQQPPILFFAAASLQSALNAIAEIWKAQGGEAVSFSYASSAQLARQLEQGAPADLFASADLEWMDWAQRRHLIKPETRRVSLGNRLALIARREDKIDLKIAQNFPLAAALSEQRLATGDPNSVPVVRYAKAALANLGVWDQVSPRIAGTDNARAALALTARGEARLGIVYETDARAEPAVRVVDFFPAHTHPPILYPFAIVAGSKNPAAQKFLDFLASPPAIEIFTAEGFAILGDAG